MQSVLSVHLHFLVRCRRAPDPAQAPLTCPSLLAIAAGRRQAAHMGMRASAGRLPAAQPAPLEVARPLGPSAACQLQAWCCRRSAAAHHPTCRRSAAASLAPQLNQGLRQVGKQC